MVLTLYGIEPSPPARSVELVIHALGLTAEKKTVNLWENEHLKPEFVKVRSLTSGMLKCTFLAAVVAAE